MTASAAPAPLERWQALQLFRQIIIAAAPSTVPALTVDVLGCRFEVPTIAACGTTGAAFPARSNCGMLRP